MTILSNKQINHPPVEVTLLKKDGTPTTAWNDWFTSLKIIHENTVTNSTIGTPEIPTTKIAHLNNVRNGMEFYNTDSNRRQVRENNAWKFYNTSTTEYATDTRNITTVQRDAIASPQNGYLIYNSDLHVPQMYVNGAWKTITTT